MKKFLIAVFLLFVFVVAGIVVFAQFFAAPRIKEIVEKEGSAALHGDLRVSELHLQFWPPITVELVNLSLKTKFPFPPEKPNMDVEGVISKLQITMSLMEILTKHPFAKVKITAPDFKIAMAAAPAAQGGGNRAANPPLGTGAGPVGARPSGALPLFGISLEIIDGAAEVSQPGEKGPTKLKLAGWDLKFQMPSLASPWILSSKTELFVDAGSIQMSLPLRLQGTFKFQNNVFETTQTTLDVSGIEMKVKGRANLSSEEYAFDASVDLPDLGSLPVPPAFLPIGKYSGGLSANIHGEHGKAKEWTASGNVKVLKFIGHNLDYKKDDLGIAGSLSADADLDFGYKKDFVLNKIVAAAEMKDLGIIMKSKFVKPAGTPLSLSLSGREAENTLTIQTAQAVFAALRATVSGTLSSIPGKASDLQIDVPRTKLDGFEKYFPPLSSSPLTGAVEVKAHLQGDLRNPQNLSVSLNPLHLDNIRGGVHFQAPDKTINGSVLVDARAIIVSQGKNLKSASVNGQIDLTRLDIFLKDKFLKKPGTILKLILSAKQKGKFIEVSKSNLFSSLGPPVSLKGTIENPASPNLNLKIQAPQLNLAELSRLVPMLAEWKLTGTASGDVSINGNFDFAKGVEKSFFSVSGKVGAVIPQFVYKSPAKLKPKAGESPAETGASKKGEAPKTTNAVVSTPPPQPLLPDWPVMRTLRLATSLKLGTLNYNDLTITGMDWNGTITRGALEGTVKIQQIFGGQLAVNSVRTNLLQAAPNTSLQTTVTNLDVAQALLFGAPEWKDLAKGRITGTVSMDLPHPSQTDFAEKVKAAGSVKVADGFLSTFPFDQYVNLKLKGLPGGGGGQAVHTAGANANIDSKFNMALGKINLETFHILTPAKDELVSTGWLKIDKTMDLRGTIYLASAQVSGDIKEGNSDGAGRLVVPNVHFTGSILHPDVDLADTLSVLVKKAANAQFEKGKKQLQQKAAEEAKKQIQNIAIPDEAKKQLQNLFGH